MNYFFDILRGLNSWNFANLGPTNSGETIREFLFGPGLSKNLRFHGQTNMTDKTRWKGKTDGSHKTPFCLFDSRYHGRPDKAGRNRLGK